MGWTRVQLMSMDVEEMADVPTESGGELGPVG